MNNLNPKFDDHDAFYDEGNRTHDIVINGIPCSHVTKSQCAPLKGNTRDFPYSQFQALKEILEKSRKEVKKYD